MEFEASGDHGGKKDTVSSLLGWWAYMKRVDDAYGAGYGGKQLGPGKNAKPESSGAVNNPIQKMWAGMNTE